MTDFNNMPQPRTFAPSKEDVLQNLQYFFGAPVSPEKLKDVRAMGSNLADEPTAHHPTCPFGSIRSTTP